MLPLFLVVLYCVISWISVFLLMKHVMNNPKSSFYTPNDKNVESDGLCIIMAPVIFPFMVLVVGGTKLSQMLGRAAQATQHTQEEEKTQGISRI